MRIHYTQRTISTATATTEAAGFGVDNITRREIRREWRSTSGSGQTITIDLGADQIIEGLWVQQANFASCTVDRSPDNSAWTSVGTLSVVTEGNSRTKGHITVGASDRYLRLTIASGSPALGFWTIGSVFVFGSGYSMPINPQYGFQYDTVHPAIIRQLPNGRVTSARTGPAYTKISGSFAHAANEDVAALIRLARSSGIIGVDLEISTRPALQWPMEYAMDGYQATIDNPAFDTTSFELIEVV